jgi:hypothetical protein
VEATVQPAVVSKANPAPVAEVATPIAENSPTETSSVLPSTDTKVEEDKQWKAAAKRIKVDVVYFIAKDKKYVTEKVSAIEALEETQKDIDALEAVLKCMKGG